MNQFQKNISDAKGFLDTVESNLGTAVNVIQQAREDGLKASNGTYSSQDKQSMAGSVDEAINQIVTIANSQYLGKFLFSGEKTQTASFTYDGTTATYNGDNNVPQIKVTPSYSVDTTVLGDKTFSNVLNSLINLRNQIQTGTSTDIDNAIGSLDTATNDVVNARSNVGVQSDSLNTLKSNYDEQSVGLETQRSLAEDVDMTKAMTEHANTQIIYQSILATTAKMYSVSLLDYMS